MNNWFIISIAILGLLVMDVLYNSDHNKLRRIYVRSSLFCILAFIVVTLTYWTNSMDMSSIELVLYAIYGIVIIMGSIHILYVLKKEVKNND